MVILWCGAETSCLFYVTVTTQITVCNPEDVFSDFLPYKPKAWTNVFRLHTQQLLYGLDLTPNTVDFNQ